jgi:hypothetical protein
VVIQTARNTIFQVQKQKILETVRCLINIDYEVTPNNKFINMFSTSGYEDKHRNFIVESDSKYNNSNNAK